MDRPLVTGGLGIASALPTTNVSDQLVNLEIGSGSTLRDLNVALPRRSPGLLCGTGNVTGTSAAQNGMNQYGTPRPGCPQTESDCHTSEITAAARQVDAGQIPIDHL